MGHSAEKYTRKQASFRFELSGKHILAKYGKNPVYKGFT